MADVWLIRNAHEIAEKQGFYLYVLYAYSIWTYGTIWNIYIFYAVARSITSLILQFLPAQKRT